MIYNFPLQTVGICVGLVLIASHLVALLATPRLQKALPQFPRSRAWGTVLLVIATVWSFWLVRTMDLGEFARLRGLLTVAVPVGAVLTWHYVDEFLAVRSLGILALLAAEPLLSAAFLRPEISRLLLVCLAYVWIIAGLFLVGMPYILRDFIAWGVARANRIRIAAGAGMIYGAVILLCAIVLW